MMAKFFAEVAPAIPMPSTTAAAVYTYSVSKADQATIVVGSQVSIPLGRQRVNGTVLRLHHQPVPYSTKTLQLLESPPLTSTQIAFATWISTTMRGSLGYTLRLFVSSARQPIKTKKSPSDSPHTSLPDLVIEKNDAQRHHSLQEFLAPVEKGRSQALVLVPEVHLAEPLRAYLSAKYPHVMVYHSECTPSQLTEAWQAIYTQKSVIVIGTQKSLFLPWQKLTHIAIEEDYLETHKLWDAYPRLDNRDAVVELARLHNSRLLYASSVYSLARFQEQQEHRVTLVRDNPVTPKPKIVALSFDDRRQGHLLPGEVIQHLKDARKHKEKTVILYNQRGSWRAAVCTKCHQALRCPDCQSTVFVVGTMKSQRVQCRHCPYTGPLPATCPNCKSKNIKVFGPGTAKIATIVETLVPTASVLEISAASRPSPERLHAADIIIGTTALWRTTAELTFNRAVWLFPETTLLYPDYRSHERAMGLLARLQKNIPARRRVLMLTRYADLITSSLASLPEKFFAQQLQERRRLNFPPYTDLVKLTCHARSEAKALEQGGVVRQKIEAALPARQAGVAAAITIRGPYQGFTKKDGTHFAAHVLLAGPLTQLVPLYKDLPIARAELSPAQIL